MPDRGYEIDDAENSEWNGRDEREAQRHEQSHYEIGAVLISRIGHRVGQRRLTDRA